MKMRFFWRTLTSLRKCGISRQSLLGLLRMFFLFLYLFQVLTYIWNLKRKRRGSPQNGIQIPHHDPRLLLLCRLGFTPILSHPSLGPKHHPHPSRLTRLGHRIPLSNHYTPNPPRTIRSKGVDQQNERSKPDDQSLSWHWGVCD